ncbi:YqaA family protein [Telmatospirillum siberiense]|uniref:Cytochrome B n=1 Tax=Telmatospirillum siberiense TaxID=382514 RepID=A0A2N3PQW9_9PROT|nr:YqaA family protein [Telmatospirillum siberiense]PKU22801.1 cytochrome B [Telmatospirillum siberiense]
MLKRVYDWMMGLASHRYALWWLMAVSFIESSVFPIPPDIMLIPMVLAARGKAWRYAALATVASVAGGWLGYGIGFFLFDAIGRPIIALYHLESGFATFQSWFAENGGWVILAKGWTPIPFKLITITAGFSHLDPLVFTVASIVSRAMRFFLVAGLLYYFGEPIRDFIERRLTLVTTAFVVALVGGFLVIRYI